MTGSTMAAVRTYTIRYPSSTRFALTGRLVKVDGPSGPLPAIDDGGRVLVLDPRAVIEASGVRVHGPRDLPADDQYPWVRDWLAEHPRWDR